MLNSGMDIKDFEDREKRKGMIITDEAGSAENMANLFLMEIMQESVGDFNKATEKAFVNMSPSSIVPILQTEEIGAIRNYLKELISEWEKLPAGETMNLLYNIKNQ
ncbi:MAG: hypothetical protein JST47_12625 [Bacteroidetes bacterium]|nr:hypothetical protein [Bacteroidota bacterium]MBS1974705.1 hypothetical protein [Bacteroidota bacterium]